MRCDVKIAMPKRIVQETKTTTPLNQITPRRRDGAFPAVPGVDVSGDVRRCGQCDPRA